MICHIKSILAQLGPKPPKMGELADSIGVNRNTISRLTNNEHVPNLELAFDIRDKLNQWAVERGKELNWTIDDIWSR
ncbi:helix-turn-helix domain-containing protein [Paenibacillus sp. GbtcB18]|uniref:helix-turn-helix transcriptional regulator n=1 Tax=Paenibacillus sp. GbtcB18 TaxID=2824763 RepID=UPI001C308CA1|nr:helix-turn-helix domain-containing protein [Paenibacillus sp. GbtcB18]